MLVLTIVFALRKHLNKNVMLSVSETVRMVFIRAVSPMLRMTSTN